MIEFFKKIFTKTKKSLSKREYTQFEKVELERLERHRKPHYSDGEVLYIEIDDNFIESRVLGSYSYEDVDGSVYGTLVKTCDGRIININWARKCRIKPHDWIYNLSNKDKDEYLSLASMCSLEDLYNKFYHRLDKGYLRDQKLKQLGI